MRWSHCINFIESIRYCPKGFIYNDVGNVGLFFLMHIKIL